jgi:putative FmdB family regulatory protein
MPTYTYFCEKCDKEFEEFHSIKDQLEECPTCKKNGEAAVAPKRLINGSSFILLGGGWAAEGYK